MKWWYILVACMLFPLLAANKHPIYISKTEAHFKPQFERLEFSMEIFIDDLEEALEEKHGEVVEIGTEREKETTEDLVWDYVDTHFDIYVNGEEKSLVYFGREIPNNEIYSMYLYFVVEDVETIKSIEVKNTLLHEVIDEQRNFVFFDVYGEIEDMHCIKHDAIHRVEF